MYICYLDESGSIEPGSSSTHFILIGLAIPADTWKLKDHSVSTIKKKYDCSDAEVHTGWMLRQYAEQNYISNFEQLDYSERRRSVMGIRALNLTRPRTNKKQKELIKNYRKTEPYIRLSFHERLQLVEELADLIGSWTDCRIFGDAQDKQYGSGEKSYYFAFEQIVTRFNTFLSQVTGTKGIIVQ